MSTSYLLIVAMLGLLFLTYLIIVRKMHPYVTMIVVAALIGISTGMAPEAVLTSMQNGMGGTLGFVATVVGLGAMFGQFLEESGGVDRLAISLTRKFGEDRSQWALMLTGFLVAIPVFFEVGLIILIPLIYSMARKTGKSLIYYGIPLVAGLAVTHAFVPPTPGPVAVASLLGADLGLVIIFGIIIGLPTAIIAGPIFGSFIAKKYHIKVPEHEMEFVERDESEMPRFSLIFSLLAMPIVMIFVGTISKMLFEKSMMLDIITFIGHPFMALSITVLVSFRVLGTNRGLSRDQINKIASKALEPTAMVILVTGAGGMLKQVLIDSGVGPAFGEMVSQSPLPPLLAAFLIALAIRMIQGSATVAMLTAAGLVAPLASMLDLSAPMLALLTISIAAGSTAMSHVNDTGFWIVNRYFGLTVKETLMIWTNMENIIGVVGLSFALLLSMFVV